MSDSDGYKQQIANFWRVLNVSGDILSRIHPVLDHMNQLSINLPILLWEISWKLEGPIDDALVLQDNDGVRRSASETRQWRDVRRVVGYTPFGMYAYAAD
jgi:hypothetical protein